MRWLLRIVGLSILSVKTKTEKECFSIEPCFPFLYMDIAQDLTEHDLTRDHRLVDTIRGRGLVNITEIHHSKSSFILSLERGPLKGTQQTGLMWQRQYPPPNYVMNNVSQRLPHDYLIIKDEYNTVHKSAEAVLKLTKVK